jgi:electron transfer flavoprotein alpha subunit
VLVIAEQRNGTLNRASWEAIAAGQQLAAGSPVTVAVAGAGSEQAAKELAAADVAGVIAVTGAQVEHYTADGWVAAHAAVVASVAPQWVVLPHTYQTRDFAPALAVKLDRALVTDCTGIKTVDGKPAFTRPMYQGKLAADVRPLGEAPWLVTFQIGAFRGDQAKRGASPANIRVDATVEAGGAVPGSAAGRRSL